MSFFRVDKVPYQNAVDRLSAALEEAKQGENVAIASVELATATLTRADANLEFTTRDRDRDRNAKLIQSNAASQEEYDLASNRFAESRAAVVQSQASLTQARLSVDLAKAKIEQVKTQLDDAKYDLEQTTVVAPSDGYVTNLQLREGMLVGGASGAAVMSFVLDSSDDTRGVVVAAFNQKNYLRIREGQYAEVALYGYPGEIFTGRVLNTIDVSGAGQLSASGMLPSDLGSAAPAKFAVKIKLDRGDELRLPGGSQAQVAVYTEDIQFAGIPVMFLIRAQSWLRYLL
jgi:multidrug resistance efflux pump